jgi:hypothetical protein
VDVDDAQKEEHEWHNYAAPNEVHQVEDESRIPMNVEDSLGRLTVPIDDVEQEHSLEDQWYVNVLNSNCDSKPILLSHP